MSQPELFSDRPSLWLRLNELQAIMTGSLETGCVLSLSISWDSTIPPTASYQLRSTRSLLYVRSQQERRTWPSKKPNQEPTTPDSHHEWVLHSAGRPGQAISVQIIKQTKQKLTAGNTKSGRKSGLTHEVDFLRRDSDFERYKLWSQPAHKFSGSNAVEIVIWHVSEPFSVGLRFAQKPMSNTIQKSNKKVVSRPIEDAPLFAAYTLRPTPTLLYSSLTQRPEPRAQHKSGSPYKTSPLRNRGWPLL